MLSNVPFLSIAPMMDCTDRHFRFFIRQITRKTLLYTEMIVDQSICHAQKEGRLHKILDFDPIEQPVICQLGGSDPRTLSEAAKICEDWGYVGINLNVGCPSSRVQSGKFGACLMKEPGIVAHCLESISNSVSIPVSVKHRLGVDELDRYEDLQNFVRHITSIGVQHFIVHARKAWLKGLSPAENRTKPPLDYSKVYQLKSDFPDLTIEINGGIKNLKDVENHLKQVDAVMIGRAAYDDPWIFSEADSKVFSESTNPCTNRLEVLLNMVPYLEKLRSDGLRYHAVLRHMMGLYKGVPGARRWRRWINEKLKENPEPTFIIESAKQIA